MDIKQILTADVLDIIFEGRNKSYGAYELRKTYNKRILTALMGTAVLFALLYSGYLLAGEAKVNHSMIITDTIQLVDVDIKEDKQPEIIPPKPQPLAPAKQIQNVVYLIVPDQLAKTDVAPPTQEELADAKIGFQNIAGESDKDFVGPPIEGVARGIISAPEKKTENDDYRFMPVEIQAEYPGGASSWTRFLIKTLSNYPEEAIEKGIQGTVIVKFIVDKEGNVSDIQAESGPEELRETAVKAIKKSGKWIPAMQNGRKVITYKKQPISFKLGE